MCTLSVLKTIFGVVVSLLVLIAVGYIARKTRVLSKDGTQTLSKVMVNIAIPALILYSFTLHSFEGAGADTFWWMLGASVLYYAIGIGCAYAVPRLIGASTTESGIYSFILMMSAAFFFGYPIISTLYGKEYLLEAAVFNIPYFLLGFSIGILLLMRAQKTPGGNRVSLHNLANIPLAMSFIGFALFMSGVISYIPPPVVAVAEDLGNMTIPLALIIAGSYMTEVTFSRMLLNVRHYGIASLRLCIIPVLLYGILRFMDAPPIVTAIAVISAATPAAFQVIPLADTYGESPIIGTEIVCLTAVLSLITIPVLFIVGVVPCTVSM